MSFADTSVPPAVPACVIQSGLMSKILRRMQRQSGGILALWNNCAAGHEAEYEAWYQGEHLPERLAVPGILRGRRYEALAGAPHYFTYYETVSPGVFSSEAYLERVENPTPMTRKIMSGIFIDMSRTVCRRAACHGDMRGAVAVTARLTDGGLADGTLTDSIGALAAGLADLPGVARAELWVASGETDRPVSAEAKLRGGDETIAACLFVECLREGEAQVVRRALDDGPHGAAMETGVYRLLCERTGEGTSA